MRSCDILGCRYDNTSCTEGTSTDVSRPSQKWLSMLYSSWIFCCIYIIVSIKYLKSSTSDISGFLYIECDSSILFYRLSKRILFKILTNFQMSDTLSRTGHISIVTNVEPERVTLRMTGISFFFCISVTSQISGRLSNGVLTMFGTLKVFQRSLFRRSNPPQTSRNSSISLKTPSESQLSPTLWIQIVSGAMCLCQRWPHYHPSHVYKWRSFLLPTCGAFIILTSIRVAINLGGARIGTDRICRVIISISLQEQVVLCRYVEANVRLINVMRSLSRSFGIFNFCVPSCAGLGAVFTVLLCNFSLYTLSILSEWKNISMIDSNMGRMWSGLI